MISNRLILRNFCLLLLVINGLPAAAQRVPPAPSVLSATLQDDPTAPEAKARGVSPEARSIAEDLEERLSILEARLRNFDRAEAEKIATISEEPVVEVIGRLHIDYWSFPQATQGIDYFEHPNPGSAAFGTDPENRLIFRRMRIGVQGEIPTRMFYRIQIDFATPSEPNMKDVYIGWYLPGNRNLRLGHSKRPLGMAAWSSSRFNVFLERPLAVAAFNPGIRRLGFRMQGYRDDLTMSWQYGMFGLQNVQDFGKIQGDSFQPSWYGRLAMTPWYDEASGGRGYWHAGIAGSIALPDGDVSPADSNNDAARFRTRPQARTDTRWLDTGPIAGARLFEQMGLETVVNIGAVQFVGEYLTTWVQRDATTIGTGPNTFFHGGYVQASYFLTGEYLPWDRTDGSRARVHPLEDFFLVERVLGGAGGGWGAWQLAARYDYLDLSDADIRGGVQNALNLGLNWWWNSHARMQFNISRGFIEQHRRVGGFDSGDYWLMGTRFAVNF